MVLFWELKFFDLMVRHHAGVVSENTKRGWNFANSHKNSHGHVLEQAVLGLHCLLIPLKVSVITVNL